MSFIALFFPASISMLIRNRRKGRKTDLVEVILEYAVLVLINVLVTISIIVYALGMSGIDIQVFNSFPFFTKYILIACGVAWLTPYAEEVLCKFVGVSFTVEERNENSKKS